jgi:hypothetical protein
MTRSGKFAILEQLRNLFLQKKSQDLRHAPAKIFRAKLYKISGKERRKKDAGFLSAHNVFFVNHDRAGCRVLCRF